MTVKIATTPIGSATANAVFELPLRPLLLPVPAAESAVALDELVLDAVDAGEVGVMVLVDVTKIVFNGPLPPALGDTTSVDVKIFVATEAGGVVGLTLEGVIGATGEVLTGGTFGDVVGVGAAELGMSAGEDAGGVVVVGNGLEEVGGKVLVADVTTVVVDVAKLVLALDVADVEFVGALILKLGKGEFA